MTFLQPFILWGLPLALLPVVIHLLNRMRYRTQKWAAMSFLFSANRASTRYAKLRQWLILACRVLALGALVVALARPLAGGWLGWALSPAPDVIVVLLDRSASMEARDAANSSTRREEALKAIASAAGPYKERTRFVLIENVLKKPQEVALPEMSRVGAGTLTGPTDTASDLPGMLEAAADYLSRNQFGMSEIWIASDLQKTNWQPESNRWGAAAAKLAGLKQTVRVRLLGLTQQTAPNVSISIADMRRRDVEGQPRLDLTLDLARTETAPATVPVSLTLDETRSHFDVAMQGQTMRIHHTVALDASHASGWGKVELPPDGNARDNAACFVYGPKPLLHSALVATSDQSRRLLRFAGATPGQSCEVIEPGATQNVDWRKYALVVWQSALPTGDVAKKLETFAKNGGVVIFFPPGDTDKNSFDGTSWGTVESAEADQAFHASHWDEQEGPLAKSDEGLSLPVNETPVLRRQEIVGGGEPVAAFADAKPFLTQRVVGKGRVYFCATLPQQDWSGLGGGAVLVPMLQRMLETGGKPFEGALSYPAGDPSLLENPGAWVSIDAPGKDARFETGVYRNGAQLIAVNRPASEDDPEKIDKATAKRLFTPLQVQFFEEQAGGNGALQGEIWKTFLAAMLALLIAEGLLSLPQQSAPQAQTTGPSLRPAARAEREAAVR